MLRTTLKRAGLGFLAGVAIGNLMSILFSGADLVSPSLLQRIGSLKGAFAVNSLFTGLMGAVAFGGMSFYDIERWPLLASSLVHCGVILAAFLPTALFLGWIATWPEILIWCLAVVVSYFIIFLILSQHYRKQVKEMNELLKKK